MAAATRAFAPFEWMLALRYLRAKRKESFVSVIAILSMVGIALGVAALIIVMAVMNGFRQELLAKILGLNGHALIVSDLGGVGDYDAVAARVRVVPGVVRAVPLVEGQVMAAANGVNSGVLVRGLRKQDLASFAAVSKTLSYGALDSYGGGDSVIIGARLAQKLGLAPGSSITLIAPHGNVTPFGTTPRIKTYRVAGTFNIGMSEYDLTNIFMPLEEAQLYFSLGDRVTAIETMVDDPDRVQVLAPAIEKAAGPDMRVTTWQQLESSFFDAIIVERNVMFLILSLIVLVAALNIISGLIMLVKDKSSDIAILRTMGASRGAIMRVFLIAGASIGVFGTFAGFVIGVAFCSNIEAIRQFLSRLSGTTLFDPTIYFLDHMPAQMNSGEVIAVVVMALALTLLATLYPSWRAARLDPVEALRYE